MKKITLVRVFICAILVICTLFTLSACNKKQPDEIPVPTPVNESNHDHEHNDEPRVYGNAKELYGNLQRAFVKKIKNLLPAFP